MDDVVHSALSRSRKRPAAKPKLAAAKKELAAAMTKLPAAKTRLAALKPAPLVRPTRAEAEAAVAVLLAWAGDDPSREGLRDTPARVAKAYEELFAGYAQNPRDILDTVFEDVAGYGELVLVRDIPFVSHCEHHMAPFLGKAHIAYYPNGGVLGLSKLGRLVDLYAKRLQTQEALTAQIVSALDAHLHARGAAVMIEAEHMCMSMRGVRKPGALTVTMQFSGPFKTDAAEQARFLTLVRAGR